MIRTRVAAIAVGCASIATAAAALSAPAAAGTAAAASHTRVISSCSSAHYKPKSYVLTCADGYTQIKHVTYASWTSSGAEGKGKYVYNTCKPYCAAGTFKHHPVTFSLGRVRHVHGQRLFTRMYVSYAGLTETFQLPTSGN